MSDEHSAPEFTTPPPAQTASAGAKAAAAALPVWKKALLVLAGLFVVAGVGMTAAGIGKGPSSGSDVSTQSRGEAALLGADGEVTTLGDTSGELPWNKFLMKGGFSLFIGFCIGYVLRTFFKISMLVVGVIAIALFGLSYAGVVNVDWSLMEGHWNDLVARVKDEGSNFKSFITGNLPSAGMASLGLFAGFKKG